MLLEIDQETGPCFIDRETLGPSEVEWRTKLNLSAMKKSPSWNESNAKIFPQVGFVLNCRI